MGSSTTCRRCRHEHPAEQFNWDKSRGYPRSWCRPCEALRRRAKRYGVTPEDIEGMLWLQDDTCALCRKRLHGVFDVDHDHACCPPTSDWRKSCGKCIRGLLCRRCNFRLGMLETASVESLGAYLR